MTDFSKDNSAAAIGRFSQGELEAAARLREAGAEFREVLVSLGDSNLMRAALRDFDAAAQIVEAAGKV